MKRISILILALIISSCSSMESDADKYCEYLTETQELMPKVYELSAKAAFDDKSAKDELEDIQERIDEKRKELEEISKKYKDDETFKDYLSDNCDSFKDIETLNGMDLDF